MFADPEAVVGYHQRRGFAQFGPVVAPSADHAITREGCGQVALLARQNLLQAQQVGTEQFELGDEAFAPSLPPVLTVGRSVEPDVIGDGAEVSGQGAGGGTPGRNGRVQQACCGHDAKGDFHRRSLAATAITSENLMRLFEGNQGFFRPP